MSTTIYKVTTEGDCEGKTTSVLGYCSGNPEDIKKFYDDRKTYAIDIKPIEVKHISKEDADNKNSLIQRKKELQSELDNINKKLQ